MPINTPINQAGRRGHGQAEATNEESWRYPNVRWMAIYKHNVFMSRWSTFHVTIHSSAFAMDKQFCRREMDEGIKKDIWSVMEDFSKAPGGKDFSKMKAQQGLLSSFFLGID